jgi:hypothetical protein
MQLVSKERERLSARPISHSLTLRRTGLSRDPDAKDWCIVEAGVEIGRIYEDLAASRHEVRWLSANNLPDARGHSACR